ncbi:MAG: hypothetical protein ACK4RF_07865 [Cyclobacteriaceae bacterium]
MKVSSLKLSFVFVLVLSMATSAQTLMPPAQDGWVIFAKVKFTSKYYKELKEYFLTPFFDSHIRALEGTEIQLRGHYMPFDLDDKKTIILSKFPYAACFFCGGAGPESVAEITFATKPPKFKADQVITVKGILKLNDADVNHLNFLLLNAELVTVPNP